MDSRALLINIGNGINLKELAPMARIRSLPEWIVSATNGDSKRPFVIICVARVEPKKNHAMLIDAAGLLRKKLALTYGEAAAAGAFKIICVGEIGEAWVTRYAEEQGLDKSIAFAGLKDKKELALLLDKSDLSVLTSTAEGKPRALMESMCMGIPCIATDVCGTRDVIEDGKTGWLSPSGEAEAFAECLFKIMHDPKQYRSFSEKSLEKAQNEFDENKVIEKLKSLYREKPRL
jgi:glycosyltransferase involved in cell wall biosynthesis